MKNFYIAITGLVISCAAYAQNKDVLQKDRLTYALQTAKDDSTRALVMTQLAESYRDDDLVRDSTFFYGQKALELSRKIGYASGEAKSLLALSYYFFSRGNFTNALELGLKALEIARANHQQFDQAFAMIRIGNVYMSLKNYREALKYFQETRELTYNSKDSFFYAVTFWRSADAYNQLGLPDSALISAKKAEDTAIGMGNRFIQVGISSIMADAYAMKGLDSLALMYYRKDPSIELAKFFKDRGRRDSAIAYAKRSYDFGVRNSFRDMEFNSALLLSELYSDTDPGMALQFHKIAMEVKDSLYGAEKVAAATSLGFQQRERQSELEMAQLAYRNRIKLLSTLSGFAIAMIVAIILYRNSRKEKQANILLQQQKNEIAQTLADLKTTQAQLIQSEKMASLGQLTAGIAHEIQNPLNFVNNFADLNSEMIDELTSELKEGNIPEAISNAGNLKANEEKINFHGKRADEIVKAMLQHSSTGNGHYELSDVNRLVGDYSRLAYQSYRSRQKNLQAELIIDTDPNAGTALMIPEDIARVIVNLLNNAFDAVDEKQKADGERYHAIVKVSTKREGGKLLIKVKDNGNGISENIRDKIFQPFFTTKPTGHGIGLGLSLSYNMVKAHKGEIEVNSINGEGSEFTVWWLTPGPTFAKRESGEGVSD
ncbi:tetratricopeptide repeat-containing sensor histidine kinase [Pollutibacter soli]|uniref:tetratricopeptide repeat-containing sensor histidine kinase n=1 Tax=Pollutibacter soli TaxID=3034157 RepID=UPI003013A83C